MSDTPTQVIVAAAVKTKLVTDDLGRTILVERMTVSKRLRFMKCIPLESQDNTLWITNAMSIASVIEIGGVPLPRPMNEHQIEQNGDLLGDEGLVAAQLALGDLLGAGQTVKEALAIAGEQPGTAISAMPSGS